MCLSLLGTFSTFVAGIVELLVTLVTLNISYSRHSHHLLLLGPSSAFPPFVLRASKAACLQGQESCHGSSALLQCQFWALHGLSKLTEKLQEAWTEVCIGASGWLNDVVWIVVIRTITKPVSECSELQPNKLSWSAVYRKQQTCHASFTLFHDLPNNSILRQALVYSQVNAHNQMQD